MNSINALSVGPIVGHADVDHVRLWGRGEYERTASGRPRRCFGIARIRKDDSQSDFGSPRYFKMNPNFDMTGVVIFPDLEPDTHYRYQMGWFFSDKELDELNTGTQWDWHNSNRGEFRTASPDNRAEREFIFGSCRFLLRLFGGNWFDSRGDKTFRSILEQMVEGERIDKLLMLGDQIYADDVKFPSADSRVDEFLNRYQAVFSQPYIRNLMSRVPTYMTLDDHEIENNWPEDANDKDMMVKYPAAIHAYEVYQVSHSPLMKLDDNNKPAGMPDRYYYRFSDGCCDFFVTDTRTEREPEEGFNDGEIISEKQLQALLDWLQDGSGKVKLIASAVPFFPDLKKPIGDKWSGYRRQRDFIIEHIRANRIEKVVFLSGDVHCSMAAELDISSEDQEPLKIYSVISSAFYWPYPHKKRRHFQLTGHVASASNNQAYALGRASEVYSGDNFTRVRVSPEELEVKVYGRKGDFKHQILYQF